MNSSKFIVLCLVFLVSFSSAQPTSRSAFFVANEGQWPGEFAYRFDGGGGSWFVTPDGLTIDLKQYQVSPQTGFGGTEGGYSNRDPFRDREPEPRSVKGHVIKLNLVRNDSFRPRGDARLGGESAVEAHSCVPLLEGKDKLASYSNYFLGQDSTKWRSRVGHYQKVVAKEVWPGIDVEYRAEPQGVEMVFHVQPGADVGQIQVTYEGLDAPLSVDSKGNLILKTSLGNMIEQAPFAYQIEHRRQHEVPVHYALTDHGYRFVTDGYDHSRELVIDPLIYSTYFGGSNRGDSFEDIVIDSEGNKVMAGRTSSEDIPITVGAYQDSLAGRSDCMIVKFSPDGHNLLYSTYIGSPDYDHARKLVLTAEDRIWFSGSTGDAAPITPGWPLVNAIDTTCEGSIEPVLGLLSTDGTNLEFSSYWGGSHRDVIHDLGMDEFGSVYLVGGTASHDFVTTPGALFEEFPGSGSAFLTKIDPNPIAVSYSTFFPGTIDSRFESIKVISATDIWLSGSVGGEIPITENAYQQTPLYDSFFPFVLQLDLNSNEILYSSYFGGSERDFFYVDELGSGQVAIYGEARSPDLPVTPDAFDPVAPVPTNRSKGYAAVLQLPGSIIHATYLGGSFRSGIHHLHRSADGSFVVDGITNSADFPVTSDAYDSTINIVEPNYADDLFISRLSADLTELEYSTFFGGTYNDVVSGSVLEFPDLLWLSGVTTSSAYEWPITDDAYQSEVIEGWWGSDAYFLCFEVPGYNSVTQPKLSIPNQFSISIYPNPFNPSTTISFTLPLRAQTSLEVFNVLGQAVYSVDLGQLPAGEYHHLLDAASLPSGTYLTRLDAGEMQEVKKMVMVR